MSNDLSLHQRLLIEMCEIRRSVDLDTDDLDWQTDTRAIRWRALMRDWWQLPPIPVDVFASHEYCFLMGDRKTPDKKTFSLAGTHAQRFRVRGTKAELAQRDRDRKLALVKKRLLGSAS